MRGLFAVVAIDGEFTEFMADVTMPYLRFDALPWHEAIHLCELSFAQGFQCVLIKQDDGEDTTGDENEQPEEAIPEESV